MMDFISRFKATEDVILSYLAGFEVLKAAVK
jgi:hypothetical protein